VRRTAFIATLLLAALLAAPSASADRLGSSNVTYYPAGPSQVALHLGDSLDYPWVFFNNETATVYVNMTAEGDIGFTALASPSFVVINASGWGQIVLRLTAPSQGASAAGSVRVHLMAINEMTNAAAQADVTLPVTLLGVPPAEDPTGKILGIWGNPLPSPFDNAWVAFALSILIWVAIAAGLLFIVHPLAKAFVRRATTKLDDVVHILRVPVIVITLLYGSVRSLVILGLPPDQLLYSVYRFPLILILTWVGYRVFRDVLLNYGRTLAKRMKSDVDDRLIPALEKVGAVVIVMVGLILAVQSLGYDITLVLAGFGVIGLVIAFAAQDTVSNFFAGIYIMLDRPFRVGDLVEIDENVICTVQEIGLRTTKLYWGKNHTYIIMPNNEMANRKIINYVRPNRRFKTNVKLGVAYKSDLDRVKRVLLEIARSHPWVLKEPEFEPVFRVVDFGESTILVMLLVWVDDVDHKWHIGSDLREQIKKRFAEEGIEISFPQRVVEILPPRNLHLERGTDKEILMRRHPDIDSLEGRDIPLEGD
jgi:small-conductance mechanosensitive channel